MEIAYTPVKGLGLTYPSQVDLAAEGVAGNRRFFVVDEHLQMVNGKRLGKLVKVKAELDDAEKRLTLSFPDGTSSAMSSRLASQLTRTFLGRPRQAGW